MTTTTRTVTVPRPSEVVREYERHLAGRDQGERGMREPRDELAPE